jgi:L-threonylcarbamoyladenylate synthase
LVRLIVDPSAPDRGMLGRAAEIIRAGGIAAIPTDTLYGLAADPFNAEAVARIFLVKGRREDRALPLVASSVGQIERKLGELGPMARSLAEAFWPGPLTLLIAAPPTLADAVTGGTGRVGVRVPAHPVPRALCEICDRPLTATSANISGRPAEDDPDAVWAAIGERLDVILDAGRTPGGPPSTIVDVTGGDVRLVRAGAIPWSEVTACLRRV